MCHSPHCGMPGADTEVVCRRYAQWPGTWLLQRRVGRDLLPGMSDAAGGNTVLDLSLRSPVSRPNKRPADRPRGWLLRPTGTSQSRGFCAHVHRHRPYKPQLFRHVIAPLSLPACPSRGWKGALYTAYKICVKGRSHVLLEQDI